MGASAEAAAEPEPISFWIPTPPTGLEYVWLSSAWPALRSELELEAERPERLRAWDWFCQNGRSGKEEAGARSVDGRVCVGQVCSCSGARATHNFDWWRMERSCFVVECL